MAAITVNQQNARTKRTVPTVVTPSRPMIGPPSWKKNSWNVAAARIARVPPTQMGFETQ